MPWNYRSIVIQNLEEAQMEENAYQEQKRKSTMLLKKRLLLKKQEQDLQDLLIHDEEAMRQERLAVCPCMMDVAR